MKKIRVLIFPSSGENSFEIYDSLKYAINLDVFGVTVKHDFSENLYPKDKLFIGDFNISSQNFDEQFNKLLVENEIDIVIPTHDTISNYLSNKKDKFEAKIMVADSETARICRNKIETFNIFKNEEFCPKFYTSIDEKVEEYPLFLKPNCGQGSQGVCKVENQKDFIEVMKEKKDYIACEFLPGEEYTVDCFTDKSGNLVFIGLRTRENISNGISTRSKSVKLTKEVEDIAKTINQRLNFIGGGGWFFQLKKDKNGKFKLLEVSCRQAGTMMLYRHRGINFALLGIYSMMGYNVSILDNKYDILLNRRLDASYLIDYNFDTVYIDYDDTLIINDKVVLDVIKFLYHCKNNNIKIYLITRHNADHNNTIEDDLKLHCLDKCLFDKIINLTFNEEKFNYINIDTKAIFIDNSFVEREKVYKNKNIPVFDVDAVKGLIIYT